MQKSALFENVMLITGASEGIGFQPSIVTFWEKMVRISVL
jgi:NADP-dependent 3-hydroxy acid dehydrogenase YdfG